LRFADRSWRCGLADAGTHLAAQGLAEKHGTGTAIVLVDPIGEGEAAGVGQAGVGHVGVGHVGVGHVGVGHVGVGGDERGVEAGSDALPGLGRAGMSKRVWTVDCRAMAGSPASGRGSATVRVCLMRYWIG
jgi:hypothetical protein